MRIGFFTDSYLPAMHGVQVSIGSFRKTLEALGHTVYVYAPESPHYREADPCVFRLASVPAPKVPGMRIAFPAAKTGTLKQIVETPLDIAHAHSPFSLGFFGKFIAEYQRIPFVYTHQTDIPAYAKVYFPDPWILPALARSFCSWFANFSDAIIALSPKGAGALRSCGVSQPIAVLPTGIEAQAFRASPALKRAAQELRERLRISPKTFVCISLGRLAKEKNIAFLLEAFREVENRSPDSVFLIVGNGPYRPVLERKAKALHLRRVQFLGAVPHDNIAAYYHAADAFLFASQTDMQGIVILEAMASGLPIIALKDDAITMMAQNDVNGILLENASPVSFASAVISLAEDRFRYARLAGASARLAQTFTQEQQTQKLLAIYQSLARAK